MTLLDLDGVAGYLLGRGVIETESIVDGELEVARLPGRNMNFKITCRQRDGLILKQAPDADEVEGSVLREARLYGLLARDAAFAAARPFVPELLEADADGGIMLARLLLDARSLDEWGRFDLDAGRNPVFLFGRALAIFHSLFARHLGDPRLDFLPRHPGPALGGLVRPTVQLFADASPANLQFIHIVQHTPALERLLAGVTATWPLTTVIHGDLKSRNVLVHQRGAGALRITVVDWELAGLGDPAWDIACVLSDLLERFVLTSVITKAMTAEEIVARNDDAFLAFRRNARVFWFAYGRYLELEEEPASLLPRAVRLLAGALVQSAYESVAFLPELTPQAVYLMQMASNIADDVDRATEELLGLDG